MSMQVYDSSIPQTPVISALKGVWEKRSLLKLLVARDLTVRYKRSVIGIWWSLLNPLFTTAVMFYVFNIYSYMFCIIYQHHVDIFQML